MLVGIVENNFSEELRKRKSGDFSRFEEQNPENHQERLQIIVSLY